MSWISRGIPVGVRHAAVAERCGLARGADVVYATSMIGRAALGATAARKPLVIKLTTDEAYERAQRRGLYDGDLDAFQHAGGDVRIRALRRSRDAALRQGDARRLPERVPAGHRRVVGRPGRPRPGDPEPGARPSPPADARRGAGARRHRWADHCLCRADRPPEVAGGGAGGVGAGGRRLATRRGRWARAGGDGALRRRATARRASALLGPLARDDVLCLFRAADASLLSRPGRTSRTRWSSRSPSAPPSSRRASVAFPRSCRTAKTGCSWLRVTRALSRRPSTASTANAACASGWRRRRAVGGRLRTGRDARAHRGCARGGGGMRKLLMVGRTRYRLPLSDSLARKFSALHDALDVRVVASSADGSPGDATFSLWRRLPVLDGAAFYGALPFRVARELRRFRPDAVTARHLRCSRPAASCARAPRSSSSSTAIGARSRASTAAASPRAVAGD